MPTPFSDSWVCTNTHYCSKCQIALCWSFEKGSCSQQPLRMTAIILVTLPAYLSHPAGLVCIPGGPGCKRL